MKKNWNISFSLDNSLLLWSGIFFCWLARLLSSLSRDGVHRNFFSRSSSCVAFCLLASSRSTFFMTEHELWPHFVCFAGQPTKQQLFSSSHAFVYTFTRCFTRSSSAAINDEREFSDVLREFFFFRLIFHMRIFFEPLSSSKVSADDDDVKCLLNFLTLECL